MMNATKTEDGGLTKKDFVTSNDVRWCPGCGDYVILNAVQRTLPELGIPREKFVIVSGIGCSSRFPYYMNTYGFHTIHGRAPTVATGVKVANPELSVWMITGDGDGLSIGGNHLLHLLRRNLDINVLLFIICHIIKHISKIFIAFNKLCVSVIFINNRFPLLIPSINLIFQNSFWIFKNRC